MHFLHDVWQRAINRFRCLKQALINLLINKPIYDVKAYHPDIDRFIWESMKYSSNALETPSQILSGIRRYNLKTTLLIKKIENNQIGPKHGAKELIALNKKVENGALKEIITNYTKLHDELIEAGIDVGSL